MSPAATPGSDVMKLLVDAVEGAVGAVLGTVAVIEPGGAPGGEMWVLRIEANGRQAGHCTIAFPVEAAVTIASHLGKDAAADEQVEATVRELAAETTAFLTAASPQTAFALSYVRRKPAAVGTPFELRVPGLNGLAVLLEASLGGYEAAQAPGIEALGDVNGLDMILDIELPLTVRFGQTEMPLRQLARLGPGSMIELGRSADEPVDVLISDRMIARGEVVIAAGNYAVRITEVVSASERLRSLEI